MTDRLGPFVLGPTSVPEQGVYCADALAFMRALPDGCVNLSVHDIPYYKVKNELWDRAWEKPEHFLAWVGELCAEWARTLAPNGSLYVFASPDMAARVEAVIAERLHVLNAIVWNKTTGNRNWSADKEQIRAFLPNTERIIFAERYGADGEAAYGARCDTLRGFIFEPIRAYLDGERKRAGIPHRRVIAYLGMTGHDTHFFSPVQWKLPLQEQYDAMRQLFNAEGQSSNGRGGYLQREHEDLWHEHEYLRRKYEDLRREYEDLRRPFNATADAPFTDVWDFPAVQAYPGKHPCEKPIALMEHIVRVSSRPGDVVMDCFSGHGTTLAAARNEGRRWLGCDTSELWVSRARLRLRQRVMFAPAVTREEAPEPEQLALDLESRSP